MLGILRGTKYKDTEIYMIKGESRNKTGVGGLLMTTSLQTVSDFGKDWVGLI